MNRPREWELEQEQHKRHYEIIQDIAKNIAEFSKCTGNWSPNYYESINNIILGGEKLKMEIVKSAKEYQSLVIRENRCGTTRPTEHQHKLIVELERK